MNPDYSPYRGWYGETVEDKNEKNKLKTEISVMNTKSSKKADKKFFRGGK